jgi:RNA polymerase sigma-70 factor (ECF subfamily)
MEPQSLATLIEGAQRGDGAAFDRLVGLFGHRIFGFLYRMSGSRSDAEDMTQEVFVRLVRTLGTYKHDGRFESWLFRIAANLARDRIRRLQRTPKHLSAVGDESDDITGSAGRTATSEPADEKMIRREQVGELQQAMAMLPDAEREVIMLRHFSQMSFKEIAEATGTPLGTALARGHRGLARLREIMHDFDQKPTVNRNTRR